MVPIWPVVIVGSGYGPAFSRRDAPELCVNDPPKEGVGNAGCRPHPQPRVAKIVTTRA
jgi:hypothetical protein